MKKTLVLAIVAGMLLSLTGAAMAEPVTVGNFSFEEPCTVKQYNWQNVPNWNSNPTATNSGVDIETSEFAVTDGQWLGYLWNADPSVYNLTDRTIAGGEVFILTVDASNGYTGDRTSPRFKMTLYYDNGGSRVPVASRTFTLPETHLIIQWCEYSIEFHADLVPASIGKKIGIEFENTLTSTTTSWLLLNNVRLVRSLISNPSPINRTTFVAVTAELSWDLDPSVDKCDVYLGTDSDVTANPRVIDGARQTSYIPPGGIEPETLYFWRVDTYVGETLHEGYKREFTTAPSGSPQEDVYYVSGTYGSDSNPGTINEPWQTISKANSMLQAGDTVYIRGGIYIDQQIDPDGTGNSNNPLAYVAHAGETPIIRGMGTHLAELGYNAQIALINKEYITLSGISMYDPNRRWFHIKGCNHITFDKMVFDYAKTYSQYCLSRIENSSNTQFIDCSWDSKIPEASDKQNDFLGIQTSQRTLFLRCNFADVSHNPVYYSNSDPYGTKMYVVFKDCTVTNKWRHGLGNWFDFQLIDNCTFAGVGRDNDKCPFHGDRNRVTPAIYVGSNRYSIIRNNVIYGCDSGVNLRGGPFGDSEFNAIYHNTVYNADGCDNNDQQSKGTSFYSESNGYGLYRHLIINNIFWKSEHANQIRAFSYSDPLTPPMDNIISYNIIGDPSKESGIRWQVPYVGETVAWQEANSNDGWADNLIEPGTESSPDPLFVDDNIDPPNLNLQPGSPAIDSARYMTLADGAGSNSVNLKCDDVFWAFSGPNPPWNIIHPDIQADRIYFQQSDNSWVEKTVAGIDHDTKTIALDTPASWNNNTPVYYKKFNGDAPDIGAYEFTGVTYFPIGQADWSLVYVDSEELVEDGGYPAENSFDGDPDTFWSTKWSLPDPEFYHPHEIQIDLGGFYDICGFRYLPRQDEGPGDENGMIKDYEFYVSGDTDNWGTAVASGTWIAGKAEKQVSFDHVLGQYIRLVALSEVNGNPWTTMAELNVLAVRPDSDINDDGKVNLEDFAVLSVWWDDENACSSPGWCGGADFDMNGTVDFTDLTYFAENWLRKAD